jgi:hypothetical protein
VIARPGFLRALRCFRTTGRGFESLPARHLINNSHRRRSAHHWLSNILAIASQLPAAEPLCSPARLKIAAGHLSLGAGLIGVVLFNAVGASPNVVQPIAPPHFHNPKMEIEFLDLLK